jgi:hypothetical protein
MGAIEFGGLFFYLSCLTFTAYFEANLLFMQLGLARSVLPHSWRGSLTRLRVSPSAPPPPRPHRLSTSPADPLPHPHSHTLSLIHPRDPKRRYLAQHPPFAAAAQPATAAMALRDTPHRAPPRPAMVRPLFRCLSPPLPTRLGLLGSVVAVGAGACARRHRRPYRHRQRVSSATASSAAALGTHTHILAPSALLSCHRLCCVAL